MTILYKYIGPKAEFFDDLCQGPTPRAVLSGAHNFGYHGYFFKGTLRIKCNGDPKYLAWKGEAYLNGKLLDSDRYNPLSSIL